MGQLVARCRWTRLCIASGRITLIGTRIGHKSVVTSEDPETGVRQRLAFSAEGPDSASLHYEYTGAGRKMTVDVERSAQVSIHFVPSPNSERAEVRYHQPERGPVSLEIRCVDGDRRIAASGFWRLVLAAPELCAKHFLPVAESLRPGWALEAQARQLEEALLAGARSGPRSQEGRWAALVRDLGHPRFQRRQQADRQLRAMGQFVVPFLERLESESLSTEQRVRVRHILEALAVPDGDTPVRVAAWLAGDAEVWIALLDRPEAEKRAVAMQRLATLCGRPLALDPLARADERHRQIARLRAELGLDPPIRISEKDGGATRHR